MSRRCDYYFLCDARIQESLSEGERGEAQLPKNNRNNIIFNPQLNLQFYRGGGGGGGGGGFQHFLGGGVQLFSGGVQMLISIKTHNL